MENVQTGLGFSAGVDVPHTWIGRAPREEVARGVAPGQSILRMWMGKDITYCARRILKGDCWEWHGENGGCGWEEVSWLV